MRGHSKRIVAAAAVTLVIALAGVEASAQTGLPSGYHTRYEDGTLMWCWDGDRDEVLDKIKEVDERRYVLARVDESNIYRVEYCVKRRGR